MKHFFLSNRVSSLFPPRNVLLVIGLLGVLLGLWAVRTGAQDAETKRQKAAAENSSKRKIARTAPNVKIKRASNGHPFPIAPTVESTPHRSICIGLYCRSCVGFPV